MQEKTKAKRVKERQAQYDILSAEISRIIEESGLSVLEFSRRYKIPQSTLYQIVKGLFFYDATKRRKDIERLAESLSDLSGELITANNLLGMILQEEINPEFRSQPIRLPSEEPEPKKVLSDFKRLGLKGREPIWSGILEQLIADYGALSCNNQAQPFLRDSEPVERLVELLRAEMARHGLTSVEALVVHLMERSGEDDTPEIRQRVKGFLDRLLLQNELPATNEPGAGSALYRIAKVIPRLEGASFAGDIGALLNYCGLDTGLKPETNGAKA